MLIVKQLIGCQSQTFLHVDHHGSDLLAEVGLEELAGDLKVLSRDALPGHQGRNFIRERVTIVVENVVSALSVLLRDVFEQLHEDILGYLRLPQTHYLCRLTCKTIAKVWLKQSNTNQG